MATQEEEWSVRGYYIEADGEHMVDDDYFKSFKTEEEAMDKIDSIERERVKRDNANIQRVDNQIKR